MTASQVTAELANGRQVLLLVLGIGAAAWRLGAQRRADRRTTSVEPLIHPADLADRLRKVLRAQQQYPTV